MKQLALYAYSSRLLNLNLHNFQTVEAYIGLSDRVKEDTYVWEDSGVIASYTNWNKAAWLLAGDCARMQSTGKWDDVYCHLIIFGIDTVQHPIVCERLMWL